MRLWSIHPQYLDRQGLVALWREGLLAQKVLQGKTRGYKHHPQLDRFKAHPSPRLAIATYLAQVDQEACRRGYCFDRKKIGRGRTRVRIPVTRRELRAEFNWLLTKLKKREPGRYRRLKALKKAKPHPLFCCKITLKRRRSNDR
ncbi:pyrimidine dimer DNA glycosylase/endonuclease V [Candidatus Margulisiibacteriota bacterium]